MNWTHVTIGALGGALVGAAATFAATRIAAPGAALPPEPGPEVQEHRTHAAPPPTAAVRRPAQRPDGVAAVPAPIEEYIQSLEDQVAELQLQNDLVVGQLTQQGGTALEWPADLPPVFAREAFEEAIRKAAEGADGVTLADVDCDEYPCMAYLRVANPEAGMHERIQGVTGALEASFGDEEAGIMAIGMHEKSGDGPDTAVLALAAFPKADDGPPSQDLHARTQARAEDWVADQATPEP